MEDHTIDTTSAACACAPMTTVSRRLIFWPSLLMTGDMWRAQADYFGRQHQVILVDSPGHGESQSLTAPFTFAECAQVIVDVLDGLGPERTASAATPGAG